MTTLTTVVVVLLVLYGVILFIQLGALMELFEQVKQVRAYLDMEDRPTTLELGRSQGLAASAVGLPAALDDADQALALFLLSPSRPPRARHGLRGWVSRPRAQMRSLRDPPGREAASSRGGLVLLRRLPHAHGLGKALVQHTCATA